jgi:hypothetical protein
VTLKQAFFRICVYRLLLGCAEWISTPETTVASLCGEGDATGRIMKANLLNGRNQEPFPFIKFVCPWKNTECDRIPFQLRNLYYIMKNIAF